MISTIQKNDYVFYLDLAKKGKTNPQVDMSIRQVAKVIDEEHFVDKIGNKLLSYRASYIFREGIENKIQNKTYDEKRILKEDLEELIK